MNLDLFFPQLQPLLPFLFLPVAFTNFLHTIDYGVIFISLQNMCRENGRKKMVENTIFSTIVLRIYSQSSKCSVNICLIC